MFNKGDKIGNFFLKERLGRGAVGEVWLAVEKTNVFEHEVALKLPNSEDIDIESLKIEAQLWERVKGHPNILTIIKADLIDNQFFIAGEYASGGSLESWLKANDGKAPSVDSAIYMTKGILRGLEHLHSKQVIHRDMKPANILLQSGIPRIADFGISRILKGNATTRNISGTPSYMAPECFMGDRSEHTDIWAVGIMLHQLLTGKLPYPQNNLPSIMYALTNGEPEIDPNLPKGFEKVIVKSLAKDINQRYSSAQQMLNDLEEAERSLWISTKEEIDKNAVTNAATLAMNNQNFLTNGSITQPDATLSVTTSDVDIAKTEAGLPMMPPPPVTKFMVNQTAPVGNTMASTNPTPLFDPQIASADKPVKKKSNFLFISAAVIAPVFAIVLIGGLIWMFNKGVFKSEAANTNSSNSVNDGVVVGGGSSTVNSNTNANTVAVSNSNASNNDTTVATSNTGVSNKVNTVTTVTTASNPKTTTVVTEKPANNPKPPPVVQNKPKVTAVKQEPVVTKPKPSSGKGLEIEQ